MRSKLQSPARNDASSAPSGMTSGSPFTSAALVAGAKSGHGVRARPDSPHLRRQPERLPHSSRRPRRPHSSHRSRHLRRPFRKAAPEASPSSACAASFAELCAFCAALCAFSAALRRFFRGLLCRIGTAGLSGLLRRVPPPFCASSAELPASSAACLAASAARRATSLCFSSALFCASSAALFAASAACCGRFRRLQRLGHLAARVGFLARPAPAPRPSRPRRRLLANTGAGMISDAATTAQPMDFHNALIAHLLRH